MNIKSAYLQDKFELKKLEPKQDDKVILANCNESSKQLGGKTVKR
uniref:Uncharacterized protein n=1 Tax=Tetranychus urticae TaxID=32264 RepID=T1L4B5_TETUR